MRPRSSTGGAAGPSASAPPRIVTRSPRTRPDQLAVAVHMRFQGTRESWGHKIVEVLERILAPRKNHHVSSSEIFRRSGKPKRHIIFRSQRIEIREVAHARQQNHGYVCEIWLKLNRPGTSQIEAILLIQPKVSKKWNDSQDRKTCAGLKHANTIFKQTTIPAELIHDHAAHTPALVRG